MANDENMYELISDVEEDTSLNKQLSKLLLQLEKDLEKLKNDTEEDLIDHFCELKKLKEIEMLSVINIEYITWFLESAIFNLMGEIPEEFSIVPLELYECILERIGGFSREDYLKHIEKLLSLKNEENAKLFSLLLLKKKLDKKITEEIERKRQNPVQSFFHALNARKRSLEESSALPIPTKRIKLQATSPLALV